MSKPIRESRIPTDSNGIARCTSCGAPATRTITYDLYNGQRRMTESFCDTHGGGDIVAIHRRPVVKRIAT